MLIPNRISGGACRTNPGHARPLGSLEPRLDREPPGLGRVGEGTVVTFVLIRVALGEVCDRPVEYVAASQILPDGDAIPGASVGPGERPAARPAVDLHPRSEHRFEVGRRLPIPQLADVEIPGGSFHPLDSI